MKLGIVGNGMIVKTVLNELKDTDIESTALWCRSEDRGRPVADAFGIEKIYTDYNAFLKDDSYDFVYMGLANSAHYEYTLKAIRAGRNIILEKPFTSTYQEAKQLVEESKEYGAILFEAMLSRYSANYEIIPSYLSEIGEIKLIRSTFCQYSSRYDAYCKGDIKPAFDPLCSGGALMDINVYNISFVIGLFGAPKRSEYMANIGHNGIDTSGVVTMDYGSFKAVCTGAKDCSARNGIMIQGTKGWIEVPNRPGFIENVTLHLNQDNTDTIIDVAKERPYIKEFRRMQEIWEADDRKQVDAWLQASLDTMAVLDTSRKQAGVVFPADAQS